MNLQNLILPAGTAKLAETEYQVKVNSSPIILDQLKPAHQTVNGATVYIKDVAQVRDGFVVQNNIVRTNGARGVLLSVTRTGKASTLTVVNAVKAALPRILATVPPELNVVALADQSLFVRAAIQGVLREAVIAAGLTGMLILLFLGSWRSTLIVCISIPLSILTSLSILRLLDQTINVMTLGGLALSVGILVDDATVEIENTHRNLGMRKSLVRAVIDGAAQIATPTFVSTLAICIVFVPVLLLTGTARYLFTPMAMAVVFAMLASYLLSRTLIPTMAHYLLKSEVDLYQQGKHGETAGGTGLFWRVHSVFNRLFERLRFRYIGLLDWSLRHRGRVLTSFVAISTASLGLFWPGQPMAEIEAPELDQQVREAKANLQQAQAALEQALANYEQGMSNMELARLTAERWKNLAARGVVSRQENDQYQAQSRSQVASLRALEMAIAAQRSSVAAADANVQRLDEVQKLPGGEGSVRSFTGTVARTANALAARRSDSELELPPASVRLVGGGTLLFRVAQTSTLRTYVNVPQSHASSMRPGQPARLLPGMYARVDLSSPRTVQPLLVPGDALVIRADGTQVAVVRHDRTCISRRSRSAGITATCWRSSTAWRKGCDHRESHRRGARGRKGGAGPGRGKLISRLTGVVSPLPGRPASGSTVRPAVYFRAVVT